MGRRLLGLGVMLIAATVCLWVAEAAAWIPAGSSDRYASLMLKVGVGALAAGIALRVLAPIKSMVPKERCATCGRGTEPGHTYCLDHLQAAVNATRDQSHSRMMSRPRTSRTRGM